MKSITHKTDDFTTLTIPWSEFTFKNLPLDLLNMWLQQPEPFYTYVFQVINEDAYWSLLYLSYLVAISAQIPHLSTRGDNKSVGVTFSPLRDA